METETIQKNGVHQVATDLFYIQALIVNVCFVGRKVYLGYTSD
jgi:hypothetical protein